MEVLGCFITLHNLPKEGEKTLSILKELQISEGQYHYFGGVRGGLFSLIGGVIFFHSYQNLRLKHQYHGGTKGCYHCSMPIKKPPTDYC